MSNKILPYHIIPYHFERSFSYAAPFLWNQLDMSIRMLDFDHFKSRIKTELYLRYFEA